MWSTTVFSLSQSKLATSPWSADCWSTFCQTWKDQHSPRCRCLGRLSPSKKRVGATNTPAVIETVFAWVLAGKTNSLTSPTNIATHHSHPLVSVEDLLQLFWAIEEAPNSETAYTVKEQLVIQHFKENHICRNGGRFTVPLPCNPSWFQRDWRIKISSGQEVHVPRIFTALKGSIGGIPTLIREYFNKEHAELVPTVNLNKPPYQVFYLPMHAVRKSSSTSTKVHSLMHQPNHPQAFHSMIPSWWAYNSLFFLWRSSSIQEPSCCSGCWCWSVVLCYWAHCT